MSKADTKFMLELGYLAEYTNDVLRELALHITWDGPCDSFSPRMVPTSVHCRHCAYERGAH